MNYFVPILRKLIEDILNAFRLFYLTIKNPRQRAVNLKSQDRRKITNKNHFKNELICQKPIVCTNGKRT